MRIRRRHKGLLDANSWPLPSGNRVKLELRIKGNKKKIVKIFQHTPTDEDKQIVEQNILRHVRPMEAYVSARLLARSGGLR